MNQSRSLVRVAEPLPARSISPRALHTLRADVIVIDVRQCRPTVAYRTIARLRNAGWDRGIVLFLNVEDLSLMHVASSVGASDFVLSTATRDELAIRLRRANVPGKRERIMATEPATGRGGAQSLGGVELRWRTHEVTFDGTTISLTLRELQLLSVFLEHAGEILTGADLARLAWGKRHSTAGLAAAFVCSLRKKLARFGGQFGIQTLRSMGYRFVL